MAIQLAVVVALLWARPAGARTIAYAIAIGNNAPPAALLPVLPLLHYADDDAVRYHQLFSRFAAESHLLAVLDDQTQRRYPGLGAAAQAPTLANLARIVTSVRGKMAADAQRGDRPVLYLAFSGHGVVADGGAYLAMLDGPLTRERLYADVIGQLPATYVHLIVDACSAGAVVGVRGPAELDATPVEVTLPDRLAVAEGAQRTWPTVGVVVAATAGEQAHEWSRFESGVFTHEVISGLLGAADVNRDGQIEYSELAAFIAAANRDIADPRAAPRVIARPPAIDRNAPLITVDALRDAVFLTGDASALGHFYLELDNGQRYLDAHLTAGTVRIAMPARARVFVRTATREAAIATGAGGSVAIDRLAFHSASAVARGSVESAYASGLFRHAYGEAYYRGFVDSAGLVTVAFARDAPVVAIRDAAPGRRLAIGLAVTAGAAGLTAIVSGAFAYSAKRSYDATDLQRASHDAAARYTRDLRIAIGSGAIAIAAAVLSYRAWPRAAAPVTAVIDGNGVAIQVIGRF